LINPNHFHSQCTLNFERYASTGAADIQHTADWQGVALDRSNDRPCVADPSVQSG
jgi:hypothetical protein